MPDDVVLESSTFGLEEILDPRNLVESNGFGAVVVIEWAELISALLPEDHLFIRIESSDEPVLRSVTCTGTGPRSVELCHSLDYVA